MSMIHAIIILETGGIPMAFDGIFLKQITSQLQDYIPCKINRIHQVSDTELLFQLRHERTKYQLLISSHSLYNRINIMNGVIQCSMNTLIFSQFLRFQKH